MLERVSILVKNDKSNVEKLTMRNVQRDRERDRDRDREKDKRCRRQKPKRKLSCREFEITNCFQRLSVSLRGLNSLYLLLFETSTNILMHSRFKWEFR